MIYSGADGVGALAMLRHGSCKPLMNISFSGRGGVSIVLR